MITVDFLSKRYGKLPSEIMRDATTFDLTVSQIAIDYENYLNEKEQRRSQGLPAAKKLTQEEMLDMIKKARDERKINS
jgi:hypothetical protein